LPARYVDPENARGNLQPGQTTLQSDLIPDVIPEHGLSGEQILEAHRLHNAMRIAPRPRPGSFRHPRRFS
jgi:hypothetical protein